MTRTSTHPLSYFVHVRAFAVAGTDAGLTSVPTGDILLLEADALGLLAGHYLCGRITTAFDACGRTLFPVSGDEAAAIEENGGALHTSSGAHAEWLHPVAVPVEGLRLGELRTFLEQNDDLPADTLVVLGHARHDVSPAAPTCEGGLFTPDLTDRNGTGRFWRPEQPGPRPEHSVPALYLARANPPASI
ncbi:hypothetical protein ACIOG4_27765 [Streptomyces microflavus]|uniref:hypothetical protein n=1 Tax=Streptomyces microflavus TaxID=1919 RepID=UPI00380CAF0D